MADRALSTLALCAGIGGLELGIGAAIRSRVLAYVERDPYAAAVLMARMEDSSLEPAPIWCGDLCELDVAPFVGRVDLVACGFPCQPWSVAGKRKGTEDERWIWPAIVRIIRDCGAPLVFLENVPGLLRHGLRRVLSDLAEIGFDAEWTCVSAADVGAPHRRERVFILAHRSSGGLGVERVAELLRPTQVGDVDKRRADVAHAMRRPRSAEQEHEHHQRPGEPGRSSAFVAYAIGGGHDGRTHDAGSGALGGDASEGAGAKLADPLRTWSGEQWTGRERVLDVLPELEHPERPRLEGRGHPWPQRFAFPPGPGDAEGWERWLAAGGPAPAEPGLRRGVDGPSARMDRLRCLGNGVVPQCAALAFRILAERLNER